ncbi:MAG: hypothetical protein AAFV93_18470 [Chloroflexota bacterium]
MQRRHFLVKEVEGDYQLKEIDPTIANAISLFGTITGQCHSVESIHWTFYFMNAHVSAHRADVIASQLTQNFLEGNL